MAQHGSKNNKGKRVRKPGRLSENDKRIALALKQTSPFLTASAIGKVLNRTKAPIASYLEEARAMLQQAAPLAAEHVITASAVAALGGDHRPAAWILGHVSAVDASGKEVRVVERDSQVLSAQGLTVNIGLAIGNIPQPHTPASTVASLPLEGTLIAVSDSIVKS